MCEWIPELQLEVHQTSLWRCYTKKIADTKQPPISVEPEGNNDIDVDEDERQRRYYNPKLEQRYYKNGIRPEWLYVHRILNHRKDRSGTSFLVKWRDLPYDQSTWEMEKNDEYTDLIANWANFIDDYWKFR